MPKNGRDSEHPELGDDDEEDERTEVTRLRDELEAKIAKSCKKMDDVERKADRLSRDVRRSYPKMGAVQPDPSRKTDA